MFSLEEESFFSSIKLVLFTYYHDLRYQGEK